MQLTDTHCHLDFEKFDEDREGVIERAVEAGVVRMLVPGLEERSSREAVKLAEKHQQVYAAVGVHPNSGLTWEGSTLDSLRKLANHEKVKAIGEIGLDYYRDRSPRYVQEQVFRHQLDLAAELELPVVVHNREATEDTLRTLENWREGLMQSGSPLLGRPGVLHSFSGTQEQARRAQEMGFFVGITGPVTFRNADQLCQVVQDVDLKQLLIETDAPFLTPNPKRGKRNEPSYVRFVAEKIAELRHMTLEDLAIITTDNAARLFAW